MSWPSASLGDICEIQIGKTPSRAEPSYWNEGTLPWLSIADMNQGRRLTATKERVTEAGVRAANMKLVLPGTLLLSYKLSIGKVGIADAAMYTNEAIAALTDLDPSVDTGYLYWALQFIDLLQGADRAAMGATLNKAKLKQLQIPVPPIEEQRRIAAILDKADALRAKRREAIAKLDQLLQSVFLDMFGDPAINSKDWPTRSLKELGKVQTGSTPPSAIDGMFDGSVPFVTPGDLGGLLVTSKRTLTSAGVAKSRLATPGSTLVCCIGATIGKMGMATQDSAFNQQINAVSWGDKVLPLYGFHLMRFFGEEIATRGASTTLPILKKSAFEKIEVPVASIELQQHFALVAESIVRQQNIFLQSAKKQDALFASLQHRAFSGTL